jgi:pimeloyl-ACP methyl ester carboxylesterase
MAIAKVGSSSLYYEVHGTSGDPVVFIHGSWVDHHTFDALVGPLAQNLEVMVYDRRGHGESLGPVREHPVRDDARDLGDLLASIDLYPVHLVAHSYGGAVAFRLAHDRPEMVRSIAVHESLYAGLLLADPVGAAEAERLSALVRGFAARVRAGDREAAARGVTDLFSTQAGAWDRLPENVRATFLRNAERWREEFEDPEAVRPDEGELAELLIPVLLTEGERSPPFLHRITAALARSLRNVSVQTLRDSGHAPQATHPAQYAGLLVNFLLERNVPTT